MRRRISYIFFILLSCQCILSAQESDVLSVSDVEVVKAFEANLEEAKKVSNQAIIPDTKAPAMDFAYQINIVPLDIKYPDPVIRPLAYHPDEPKQPKVFWLKAGYGNLERPYVDLGYNLFLEDLYSISFFGNYQGGKARVSNFENLHEKLDLNVEGWFKATEQFELFSSVNYLNETRSINTDVETDRNFAKLNYFGGIRTNSRLNGSMDFSAGLRLGNSKLGENDGSEIVFGIPVDFGYHFKKDGLFNLHNNFENSTSSTYKNDFINDLKLSFKSKISKLNLDIGVSVLSANGTSYLFPISLITVSNEKQNISIFAGSDQKYHRNNIAGLYELNPYFVNDTIANNVSIAQSIFIGSEVKIDKYDLGIKGGYRFLTNQTGFELDANNLDLLDFSPAYADGSVVFIEAFANTQLNDWLKLGITGEKLFYDLERELGLADWKAGIFAKSNFNNKAHLKASFNYISVAKGLTQIGPLTETNALTDLSVEGDYFLGENFGFYLALNNILNTNYTHWYSYPGFGFNVNGGIKLKF